MSVELSSFYLSKSFSSCFVSIITITRNDIDGLIRTIESVDGFLSRLVNPSLVEHLIVDGLSSDGSDDFLRALSVHGYENRKFVSEKDDGIYDAMNKGVTLASGNYVIFINSGDIISDDFKLDNLFGDLDTAAIDVACAGLAYSAIVKFQETSIFVGARLVSRQRLRLPTIHQSMVYKREIIEKYPFSLSYAICGDFENFCRIFTAGYQFKPMGGVLAIFSAGGSSTMKPLLLIRESINISKKYSRVGWLRLNINIFRLVLAVCFYQISFRLNNFRWIRF